MRGREFFGRALALPTWAAFSNQVAPDGRVPLARVVSLKRAFVERIE
jgi:hypothetical protein